MNCKHLAEALQTADRPVEFLFIDELDPSLVTDCASVTYAFTKSTHLDLNFLWLARSNTKLVSLIQRTAVTLQRLDLFGEMDYGFFFSNSKREPVMFPCLKKFHLAGSPMCIRLLIRLLSYQPNLTYIYIEYIVLEEPDFNWATNISSALPLSCTSWSIRQVFCPNKYTFPTDDYRDGDVPGNVPQIKGWRTKYHVVITKRCAPDMSVQFYRVNEE